MAEEERRAGWEKRFGQSVPPLSIYIQKVLERYPKEEILKELVQNAEDAGARELVLTLDCRKFPEQRLLHPELHHGPALHVANDAPFTKSDWDNIQKTERSYKSEEWDQIGRFGIGFNAVYHLTDYPWIGSGELVGVFDPQESGVFMDPATGRPAAGHKWNLHLHRHEIATSYPDQFAPFQHAFSAKGIPGTEFRFPLRQRKSGLSGTTWTAASVESELFEAFLEDAHHLLLFLSNLATIRVRRWDHGLVEPKTLYSLKAKRSSPVCRARESSFLVVEMEEEDRRGPKPLERRHVFAVQHRVDQGGPGEAETLSKILRTLPWVAVAADIANTPPMDAGRTFCFLPLPKTESHNSTGLPVHVHGSFALTDSRRTLAQQHHSDTRTLWNALLCEEMLAAAYADLLGNLQSPSPSVAFLRGGGHEGRLTNRLWPPLHLASPHWRNTALALYARPNNVLWSEVNGSFVPFGRAFFLPENCDSEELSRFGKLADIPLVTLPAHLPTSLAHALPDHPPTLLQPPQLLSKRPELLSLRGPVPVEMKRFLLRYLLAPRDPGLLSGLRLLPVATGDFVTFHLNPKPTIDETVFLVEDESLRALLVGLEGQILSPEWNEELGFLAESGASQLVAFSASAHLPPLLHRVLDRPQAIQLLPKIWDYLSRNMSSLEPCLGLNLLPIQLPSGAPGLCPLSQSERLLLVEHEDAEYRDWLARDLHIPTLHTSFTPAHPDLAQYLWRSGQPLDLCRALLHSLPSSHSSLDPAAFSAQLASPAHWLRRLLTRLKAEDLSQDLVDLLRRLPLFHDIRPQAPHRLVSAAQANLAILPNPPAHLHFPALLEEMEWSSPVLYLQSPVCATLGSLLGLRRLPVSETLAAILAHARQSGPHLPAILSWIFFHATSLRQTLDCQPATIVKATEVFEYFRDFVMVRQGPESERDEVIHSTLVDLLEKSEDVEEWRSMGSVPAVLCDNNVFHLPYTVLAQIPYGRNVCPFLCKPHPSLSQHFLNLCSVRTSLSLEERCNIVKQIWVEYRSEPLAEDVLSFALEVLEDVSRCVTRDTALDELDLFLPDKGGVLRRSEDLVFGKKEAWEGEQALLHPAVYQEIAERLGVQSIRDLELHDFEGDWGTQFGQEVDLVSRITRLLHQYHGEHDFIQEFLQNAEDAGARRVVVMVDERRHGSSDVFSEAWATLQGPALLLHNDAVFTENDLAGIQRLGIGSKADEAGKIGRFGAGFNCAYRYTDAPHLISDDDVLCIFDPLRRYIARNPRDLPGKRLNVRAQPRFKTTFKDSYTALSDCGVELEGGTLFRLPLRRVSSQLWPEVVQPAHLISVIADAQLSIRRMLLFLSSVTEISARVISSNGSVTELWNISAETEETQILPGFVSNKEFSAQVSSAIKHIKANGNHAGIPLGRTTQQKRLLHRRESGAPEEERWLISQRLGFQHQLAHNFSEQKRLLHRRESGAPEEERWLISQRLGFQHQLAHNFSEKRLLHRRESGAPEEERWLISQRLGFQHQLAHNFSEQKRLLHRRESGAPEEERWLISQRLGFQHQLAHNFSEQKRLLHRRESGAPEEERWLISQRLGFQHQLAHNFSEVKLLPLGGCAMRVSGGESAVDFVFCSLPLPIRTNLPVTIQAHFCLDEARKTPTPSSLSVGYQWNEALKGNVVLKAYLDLLRHLQGPSPAALCPFWATLPRLDRVHTDWKDFAERFYKEAVAEGALNVPSVGLADGKLQWDPIDGLTYFPDDHEVGELLGHMGIKMVCLDPLLFSSVRDSLLAAGASLISPAIVAELLRNGEASVAGPGKRLPCLMEESAFALAGGGSPSKDPSQRRLASLTRLLEYLAQRPTHLTVNDRWALNLFGLPFKLTLDSRLDVFDDSIVFAESRDTCHLFPKSSALFLHPILVDSLSDLKMKLAPGCFQKLTLNDLPRLLKENLEPMFEAKNDLCHPISSISDEWLWGFWKLLLHLLGALKLETDTKDLFVNRAKRALSNMSDWKLVPVKQGEGEDGDLAPLSLLRFIFCPGSEEERVFSPLGVPVFSDDFRAGSLRLSALPPWTLFRDLLAADFSTGVKALAHWNDRRTIDWDAPGVPLRNVLDYVRAHANRIDSILSPLIARFPIFKTVEGVYARLDSPYPVYIFPEAEEVGVEGRKEWCQGVLFLSRIPIYDQLYHRLSIPTISLPKVIKSYVIPCLPSMKISDRVSLLAFIAGLKEHPSFERHRPEELVDLVKGLAFVSEVEGGRMYKVSAYHDHTITIFQSMLGASDFLPPPFQTPRIPLEFYRHLGLRTVPTPTELSDFARLLAGDTEWLEDSEYEERCQCLLDSIRDNALFGGKADDNYRECLNEISRLKIIPRDCRKPKYRSLTLSPLNEDAEEGRIAIRGSVTTEHESLMWTTGPCLPSWLDDSILLYVLGAATHPTVETVIQHCRNLFPPLWAAKLTNETAKGLNSPKNILLLQSVVTDIYEFFTDHLEELGAEVGELGEVPLVLVENGRRLAPPSMVVCRMPDFVLHQRISPFLYEVPLGSHRYLDFLQLAGVRESAEARNFARALELFREKDVDTSNPNVAEAIMMAQKGIVSTLENQEEPLSSLCLLGADLRLHHSHLLFLKDKELDREIQLDEVAWLHPDEELNRLKEFITALPLGLRPQLLSEIIAEEVDGDRSEPCHTKPCPVRLGLENLLQSEEFGLGVEQIFTHDKSLSATSKEALLCKLQLTRVACFSVLGTHLIHRNTGLPVSEESRRLGSHYSGDSECLSVEHAAASSEPGRSGFIQGLARTLHSALPFSTFESALLLQQLLDVREAREARIRPDLLPPQTQDVELAGPRVGDRLGAPVLDHLLLSSLHFYSPGELVGYLLPSQEEEMHVVMARVSSILERRDGDSKAITQHYRLILEEKPHMTPKTVEATALDMFKFSKLGEVAEESSEDEWDSESEAAEESESAPQTSEFDSHLSGSHSSLNSPPPSDSDNTKSLPVAVDSVLDSEEDLKSLDSPRLPRHPPDGPRTTDLTVHTGHRDPIPSCTSKDLLLRPVQPKQPRRLPKPIPRVRAHQDPVDGRTDQEIMESVSAELAEAAKLPDPEKKKLVRRLLLQWHPDKNKDRDTHAIFVHLKAEIRRLEDAALGEDWYEKWWAAWKKGGAFPKGRPPSPKPQPHTKPDFKKPPKQDRPPWNPDEEMASRYWAQAIHDRTAAKKEIEAHDDQESFGAEHVIYLCQQSVEKMLKAAMLKTKGTADRYSNLRHLFSVLIRYGACDEELKESIEEMMWRCDVDLGRLRYPDFLPAPLTPHLHYTPAQRLVALQKMDQVHSHIQRQFAFPT